jgi:AraC-like DNA-binding protein
VPEQAASSLSATLRADAAAAILALGDAAATMVPAASLVIFGSRLGWSEWIYDGSSLAGRAGPPPSRITVADDLIISANLFSNVGAAAMLRQSIGMPQPAAGPVARLALAHAPTLCAIFDFLRRLMGISGPHSRPVHELVGDQACVSLVETVPMGGLLDYLGLLFIGFHYRVVDDLLAIEAAQCCIALTLAESPESDEIRQLFRCEVRFGAARNQLFVPRQWLDVPNPGHDAQLWALAGERLNAAEAQFSDSDLVRRLRQRIADIFIEQRKAPRLKQVAQAEGISTRSLVRHIAAAGHSFHGLVEQERRLQAAKLINEPNLSIRAISDQLGFPDVSSFGRKFRKWFGDSPGHFRRNGR